MGRVPAGPPTQRTQLSQGSLIGLVVALGSAQLGLLSLVDCEASVVGASVFGCSALVTRPLVLGQLRGSPRWLLWLAVLAGYALSLVCSLFFFAALAHWARVKSAGVLAALAGSEGTRGAGSEGTRGP
ncbi:hypothetical protein T492DRAFT_869770, partial [Pavlovales sp. CCMP2436]